MSYVKQPFYQSSTFWLHIAVSSGAVASTVTTFLDKGFLTNHPLIAATVVAVGGIAIAVSQFGYSLASGMKSQAAAASVSSVPVSTLSVDPQG